MTKQSLKFISEQLNSIISYEFGQWSGDLVYPYWVGEYSEVGIANEDGMCETTFILTGTTRGTWLDLENDKEKIKNLFKDKIAILDKNGIAIFYENGLIIPIDDMELKRMQINLQVKEWEV